jgi:hypothetical protein
MAQANTISGRGVPDQGPVCAPSVRQIGHPWTFGGCEKAFANVPCAQMETSSLTERHYTGAAGMQLVRRLRPETALVAVLAALACGLLLLLPAEMSPDGWFALLSGHEIVAHGLPSHDTLTVWGLGRRWVDQQWLAQLAYYGLYSLGGLRLALLANAGVVVGAVAAAIALGRARGGSLRNVLTVSLPAVFVIGWSGSALRPQTLALPLFIALVWLLVRDARRPSPAVFFVVPVLALWANVHGTVVLGSLLVVLHAATSAWARRRVAVREPALLGAAVVLPFASPYAPHLAGYYRALLFNSELAKYVPDWMPTAPSLTTLPFYLLALGTAFLLGRARGTITLFERVTLVVLLILGVEAARGVTWFALFALLTLPTMLNGVWPGELRVSRRIAPVVLAGSALAVAVALVVALAKPHTWVTSHYPPRAARTAAATAGNESQVFANGAFADWLLLVEPSLRGRVAYDARFELLPHGRLADAAAVSIGRADWPRILAPFDVVVLRPEEDEMRGALLRAGRWTRVPTDSHVVVFRRVG